MEGAIQLTATVVIEADDDPPPINFQPERQSIQFQANICLSKLESDATIQDLIFDHCGINQILKRTFKVINNCDIPLIWRIQRVRSKPNNYKEFIKFIDMESSQFIDNTTLITPPNSSKSVIIQLQSSKSLQFFSEFKLVNVTNPKDFIDFTVRGSVGVSDILDNMLTTNVTTLDFGNCYSGVWTSKTFTLKNWCDELMEVTLKSDLPGVKFQYLTEDLTQPNRVTPSELPTPVARSNNPSEPASATGSMSGSPTKAKFNEIQLEVDSNVSSVEGFESSASSIKQPQSAYTPALSRLKDSLDTSPNPNPLLESSRGAVSPTPTMTTNATSTSMNQMEPTNVETEQHGSFIEEIIIKPGRKKVIKVVYCPEAESSDLEDPVGKLIRKNFQISISYSPSIFEPTTNSLLNTLQNNRSSEKLSSENLPEENRFKIIQCKSKVCTSIVNILTKVIQFGEIDIGTFKVLPVTISNTSELPAHIELKYSSKVVKCAKGPFIIPPNQSMEILVSLHPIKINPNYRKQITVVNLNNRGQDQIFEVRSTHVDTNRVTFHSLFYRILTDTFANFLDFKTSSVHCPNMRGFFIDNVTSEPLTLELSVNRPNDIALYQINDDFFESNGSTNTRQELPTDWDTIKAAIHSKNPEDVRSDRRERILDMMEERHESNRKNSIMEKSNSNNNYFGHRKTESLLKLVTTPTERIGRLKSHSLVKSSSYLDLAHNSDNRNDTASSTQLKPKKSDIAFDKFDDSRIGLKSNNCSLLTPDSERSKDVWEEFNSIKEALGPPYHLLKEENLKFSHPRWISAKLGNLQSKFVPPKEFYTSYSEEETYVKSQINAFKELNRMIKDKMITPLGRITIQPKTKFHVIMVLTPSSTTFTHQTGVPRKFIAKVLFKLLQFDLKVDHQPQFDPLFHPDSIESAPVRELMLRAMVCHTRLEVSQRSLSFGKIEKDEFRSKILVLRNQSELPLLYAVRKSGSIASGDLSFEGNKYGVIRGFGKKDITFEFVPSLPGYFDEDVTIRNVLNPEGDIKVKVKAQIKKPWTFSVELFTPPKFEPSNLGEFCRHPIILGVCNTHKLSRVFEVRIEQSSITTPNFQGDVFFVVNLDTQKGATKVLLSTEAKEKIEALEQKLKIAVRKGNTDKIKKIRSNLVKLRSGLNPEPGVGEDEEEQASANDLAEDSARDSTPSIPTSPIVSDERIEPDRPLIQFGDVGYVNLTSNNTILFTVEPNSRFVVWVWYRSLKTENSSKNFPSDIRYSNIYVHEHRNRDVSCNIPFTYQVIPPATRNHNKIHLNLTEPYNISPSQPTPAPVLSDEELKHLNSVDRMEVLKYLTDKVAENC